MTTHGTADLDESVRGRTPMSPNQIRSTTINRAGLGRRGYHEQDVDQLLEYLAIDVEGWIGENTALRADNDRLKNTMLELQRADSLIAQAEEHARRVTEHARQQYEDVLRIAKGHAQHAAEQAARDYRARAGERYSAEFEDLERRMAWTRTFLGTIHGVESQLRTARRALTLEVDRLGTDRIPSQNTRALPPMTAMVDRGQP